MFDRVLNASQYLFFKLTNAILTAAGKTVECSFTNYLAVGSILVAVTLTFIDRACFK